MRPDRSLENRQLGIPRISSPAAILPGQDGHILNPIVKQDADGKGGTVSKMGIDALIPFDRDRASFTRVKFKEVDLSKYDIAF